MQLAKFLVFASACTLVRFGSLTTARLAECDCTGRHSTHFFFYFHHIIRATSALLASSFHPCCRHEPHCHPHQYHTRRVLVDVIHTAGILFSSTSYSSLLDVIHVARILFSSISYWSCRVVLATSHRRCECGANISRSSLIFSPHHICYRPCPQQPHRHAH